jgi:hypothetical protein
MKTWPLSFGGTPSLWEHEGDYNAMAGNQEAYIRRQYGKKYGV